VYKVTEDQKVRLASLVFLNYANQWWHKLVMDIGINKRLTVVSWYDLKACMCMRFVCSSYWREHLLNSNDFIKDIGRYRNTLKI